MDAMDYEGTQSYGHGPAAPAGSPVPRPAVPPPVPAQAPPLSAVERWLRTPRVSDAPGVYAYGHVPSEPGRVPDSRVISRAVLAFLAGVLVWSLRNNGFLSWWQFPLHVLSPHSWSISGHLTRPEVFTQNLYSVLSAAVMVWIFGKLGDWPEVARRYLDTRTRRAWFALAAGVVVWQLSWTGYVPILDAVLDLFPFSWISGGGDPDRAAAVSYSIYALVAVLIAWPCAKYGDWFGLLGQKPEHGTSSRPEQRPQIPAPAATPFDATPADWPELRAAGRSDVAEQLAREVSLGRMNDVDCVRIRHAWKEAGRRPRGVAEFTDAVLRLGGGACLHPSGERDLAFRAAPHDLLGSQVRIGRGVEDERNPFAYRGSGMALDPGLLGTGLLVVGPPGADKTHRIMRPVAESLCLQALTGTAAVVAVAGADTDLGPHEAYDVVISLGDPASRYGLDLYGGTTDPDLAASLLAEALVDGPEADQRRAAAALGQLLGPYAAAHGGFPTVAVLRELLDGSPEAYEDLRRSVHEAGASALLRELDARQRQSTRPGDIGSDLANRIALLDRPAFAESFGGSGRTGLFSMEAALAHPIRVRIELPERGHAEACRVLVRLLVAQFTTAVRGRRAASRFVGLIVDDVGQAVSAETVRALASLPSTRAGMLLGLRTLDDVQEHLRGPLVAAAGCRMSLAGVTAWDGRFFAESWGTTRVETREITRADQSGDMAQRISRVARRVITGHVVTADAVTVREVERERWSASDLAHAVPAGHAVLSLTATTGEHAPPILVDLRG
ncbi:type IV secretory system conjugative DNA transfer family protein [Actinacidiphila paucisporea]|uniref:ATP/GTP-binding protein n=1 Tax=Actinacidiphila paucisporea TaxID=310782 RepID=A0A1M7KPP4_9ACTN|nr:ATP/GTP-binding protein [Actinacidiphila paucisporea]SHM67364.1 hypothetical protein SAMN05216499_11353 [Actinacidiphila paucisporea]